MYVCCIYNTIIPDSLTISIVCGSCCPRQSLVGNFSHCKDSGHVNPNLFSRVSQPVFAATHRLLQGCLGAEHGGK